MKYLVLTVLLLTFVVSSFAQERYVKPVDEAGKDKSFLAFRAKLIAAAEKKDAIYIYSILDPDIKLSFGGDAGLADFKSYWKPESKDSKFWAEFLAVIKNGGNFENDPDGTRIFYAPYTFNGFPADLDAFEYAAIFGNNVNLRDRPSTDAKVLTSLSYNVVRVTDTIIKKGTEHEADWFKISTLGGKTGYIKAEFVRSSIDYRAAFEKKRGQWRMTFFIAGD